MPGGGLTYRDAGVGAAEQEDLNSVALAVTRRLLEEIGARVVGVGGYSPGFSCCGELLTLHVDGVGTKTLVLEETGRLWVAGWDCAAMNLNDLAVAGFEAVAAVDYIALPAPDRRVVREVLEGLARALRESRVPLVGGEIAVLPGLARGVDVVCAFTGVSRYKPSPVPPGRLLVGVESSGLHANGYSLARRIVEEKVGGYNKTVKDIHVGEELSKPTHIYYRLVLEAYGRGLAENAAHLTGGGWAKLARILAEGTGAALEAPEPPRIFRVLQELGGVKTGEMYRVYNMGVGLVLAAAPGREEELVELVESHGLKAYRLGYTVEDPEKRIAITAPDGERVVLP